MSTMGVHRNFSRGKGQNHQHLKKSRYFVGKQHTTTKEGKIFNGLCHDIISRPVGDRVPPCGRPWCVQSRPLWTVFVQTYIVRASFRLLFSCSHCATAAMAEWLRRWTRNPMGYSRAGSNPVRSVSLLSVFNVFFFNFSLSGRKRSRRIKFPAWIINWETWWSWRIPICPGYH